MTQLPNYLEPYRKKAEQFLTEGFVRDIQFSGETYQVQVVDPTTDQEVWPFLQLDAHGDIKDCFCSCEKEDESEEHSYCVHIAAAFLAIRNHFPTTLNQRFQSSLWNQLCNLYANEFGDNPDDLNSPSFGQYKLLSTDKKVLFQVIAKTAVAKQHLKTLIEDRRKETETTSLKFTNLSQEELAKWRAGRPSQQLRYELSYWNDLAHWLMQLQELNTPYEIDFEISEKSTPSVIKISFPEINMQFSVPEKDLPIVIPSLATVKSPLKIHDPSQETIESIVYDKKTGVLHIEPKKQSLSPDLSKTGQTFDGWIYVAGDGFYALGKHELLATPNLSGLKIAEALNAHTSVIQERITGAVVYSDPIVLSYAISFDAKWNLHIVAYAFTPGDLSLPYSKYLGDWVYIEDKGFYRIKESHFAELETIIPKSEVGDFVYRERDWLNLIPGFQTHLSSIETQFTYNLSADNRLSFSKVLLAKKTETNSFSFGMWVYVPGQGFYAKGNSYTTLPIDSDTTIHANHIPFFIRMNSSELQNVRGFFSEKSPVEKSGLKITLTKENAINISPEYEIFPEYEKKDVRFFESYVYVAGEGFHEIPIDSRLPERFRHPVQIEPENVPLFIENELETLKRYVTNIDARLIKPDAFELKASHVEKDTTLGQGWYRLALYYQTDFGKIPAIAIWSAIKQKKQLLFDDAGCIDLKDKRFDWLKKLPKTKIDRPNQFIILSTMEVIRLNALEEIKIDGKSVDEKISAGLLHDLTEFHIPEAPDLTGMHGTLRPYQQHGVDWLWFLYRHYLSGLLCDEMGLGKTHQAMALLTAIFNAQKKEGSKHSHSFLVICPTSVIYHWQEKLQQFLPDLRICVFYGSNRSLGEFHKDYDLLLTSYGIWRLEHELLSKMSFEVAIFDEIQIAKNHNSRIHASLLKAKARMRIGLTGTPIENYLRELKALFEMVLPGYMPNDTDFRDIFVKPIEREGNQQRRVLLSRFIKPFMLRRKKKDVLPELPEKTEEISHCVLLPEQHILYKNVLHQSRTHLLSQLQDSSASVPYMHIFALLSNLKQICNHPAVYLKQPELYKEYSSGKWDLFVELLDEARESQQKVVVFSQYLNMLDILELYLDEMGIGFATIRGATVNRGEQIKRFNTDPKCEVFLGSLQAAGLGVDLTAGSVVIHYDRWWNAARENQATDRVHRIGQTRGVQVFKLVTKGTFEERIDAIISRKGRLMEEIVTADDHRFMKAFDRKELIELLEDVGDEIV